MIMVAIGLFDATSFYGETGLGKGAPIMPRLWCSGEVLLPAAKGLLLRLE
jgi:hypothetical protein